MNGSELTAAPRELPAGGQAGQVFYDAACPFCVVWARRFRAVVEKRGFQLTPLQTPGTARLLQVAEDDLMREMRLRLADGATYGGADALVAIAGRIWWAAPLAALARLPGVMPLLRAGYRRMAALRSCAAGTCASPQRRLGGSAFAPLVLLPAGAFAVRDALPPWIFMWALAFSIFLGCKWLSFAEARLRGALPSLQLAVGYLLVWPGMDGTAFFDRTAAPETPLLREWMTTLGRITLGIVLLGAAALDAAGLPPLLRGWLGMAGALLMLHFGTFHLLALMWQTAGVNAQPLMQQPLRSRSLTEFWGRRWNTAFHELAARYTFHPLRRIFSPTTAAVLVFMVSGLVHDVVISVPARGGYGLPTLYFLIQGVATAAERRLRREHRIATIAVVTLPAVVLFHPPFVHNVVLPMLDAINGLLRSL